MVYTTGGSTPRVGIFLLNDMTNIELVEKYLHSIGMKLVKGSTLEALFPFLIMDCQYQLYCKDIAPIPVKQDLKKVRNQWIESYNKFNRSLFKAFTVDEQDEIVDKMDDFSSYIQNDLVVAKVAMMDVAKQLPFEIQNVIGSCLMCNALAQMAQIIWGKVYHNRRNESMFNREIDGVRKFSWRFLNMYYKEDEHISCNVETVNTTIDILCRKAIKWLYL